MRITILVALFAVVVAAPTNDKEDMAIISTTNEINVDGNDVHDFDMADGTEDYENGKVKKFGTKPEDIGVASKGSYSYNFPGTIITVNWITDEKQKLCTLTSKSAILLKRLLAGRCRARLTIHNSLVNIEITVPSRLRALVH